MTSLPVISISTVALFFAEVRGYSKLYDRVDESPLGELKNVLTGSQLLCNLVKKFLSGDMSSVLAGWPGLFLSMISFLFFTDMCIYWIHRFLHHKLIYKVSTTVVFIHQVPF